MTTTCGSVSKSIFCFVWEIVVVIFAVSFVGANLISGSPYRNAVDYFYCANPDYQGSQETCRPYIFNMSSHAATKEQLYFLYRTKSLSWWARDVPFGHIFSPTTVKECLDDKLYYCFADNPHANKSTFCECYANHTLASSKGYDCSLGISEEDGRTLDRSVFDGRYVANAISCQEGSDECKNPKEENYVLSALSC